MNICSIRQTAPIVWSLVLYFYVCFTSQRNHFKLSRFIYMVLKLVAFQQKLVAARIVLSFKFELVPQKKSPFVLDKTMY